MFPTRLAPRSVGHRTFFALLVDCDLMFGMRFALWAVGSNLLRCFHTDRPEFFTLPCGRYLLLVEFDCFNLTVWSFDVDFFGEPLFDECTGVLNWKRADVFFLVRTI